jgi:hypothetical protein
MYAALHAKVHGDPVPPRRLRPELSPAFEEIILEALERDPDERFQTALEMRDALAHPNSIVFKNRAARVRPPERLPRWARVLLTISAGCVASAVMLWLVSLLASMLNGPKR